MKTAEIAEKLAAHCRQNNWEAAQKELYANDAVSIEQEEGPVFAKETRGLAAIREKGHKFAAMIEQVYSTEVSAPLVAGDAFALILSMDLKMKGQGRTKMTELGVYVTKDGKIISEQFFN